MVRRSRGLSDEGLAKVHVVLVLLKEFEKYLPLTLRQIYYQLVGKSIIENEQKEYKKLSRLLTKARLQGLVPWKAIEDRARSVLTSSAWDNKDHFIDWTAEDVLQGYRRNLLQNQSEALEIWIEKDALSRIVHKVTFKYCVPVIVARGFSSISFVNDCRNRAEENNDNNQMTRILYFGDLDPSGWEMPIAMEETLLHEMDLEGMLEVERCALTLDQVDEHNLPHDPSALKWTDSRASKYVSQFGEIAVELDALPPNVLEGMVENSILSNLDITLLEEETEKQLKDLEAIEKLRKKAVKTLGR